MINDFGIPMTFLEWRCPVCSFRWRTYDEIFPEHCPNCGKSFQEIQDEAMRGSE